jgi:hypothetical protein
VAASGHGEALDSTEAATDNVNKYDVGLTTNGNTPIEFRAVDQNFYLHLVLSELQSATGATRSSLSKVSAGIDKLNADLPGISALNSGRWVEVTHTSLEPLLSMLKTFESTQGMSSSGAHSLGAEYTRLIQDLQAALKAHSAATKVSGPEYNVTVDVKPFVQQFGSAVQNDLNSLPGGMGSKYGSSISSATAKIPAGQTLVMQMFVQGNKLQEVDVDLNQFEPSGQKAPFAVPLKIVFSTNPSISAPSGAKQLDLSKVPQLLGGLAGSLGGSSGGSSSGA